MSYINLVILSFCNSLIDTGVTKFAIRSSRFASNVRIDRRVIRFFFLIRDIFPNSSASVIKASTPMSLKMSVTREHASSGTMLSESRTDTEVKPNGTPDNGA